MTGWERSLGIGERAALESDGTPGPTHPEARMVSADGALGTVAPDHDGADLA